MNTDGSFTLQIQQAITTVCHNKQSTTLSTVYPFQKQFAYFGQPGNMMIALNVFGPDIVGQFVYPISGIFSHFMAIIHVDSFSSPSPDSIEAVVYVGNMGPHLGQTVMRYVVSAEIRTSAVTPNRFLSNEKATIRVKASSEINTGFGGMI